MTKLVSFADSVTGANLSAEQLFAVFYADGSYANRTAVAKQCPHAKLFGITTHGLTGKGIFACDCEEGDETVAETLAWNVKQILLKVELIADYASMDTWASGGLYDAVVAQEKKYGVTIKKWVADYDNGDKSLTIVYEGKSYSFDARQYAGGMVPVDDDIALATFFEGVTPAVDPTPKKEAKPVTKIGAVPSNTGEAKFAGSINMSTGKPSVEFVASDTAAYHKAETLSFKLDVDIKPGSHARFAISKL